MDMPVAGAYAHIYTGTKALDAGQPTVSFIHGAGLDHSVWLLQSRYFAFHGWNVLVPDLPGHGRSAGAPLTSVPAQSQWLRALLDTAGIHRSALVGHSMGSLVALEAAASYPERITALALLGAAVPMPVAAPLLLAAREDPGTAIQMITVWSHGPRGRLGGSPVPGQWLAGLTRRLLERAGKGVLYADLTACDQYDAGFERAAQVSCPSLLVCGASDQMTPPRASDALAGALTNTRHVLIADAGHSLMAEAPDAVLDALIELLPSSAAYVAGGT